MLPGIVGGRGGVLVPVSTTAVHRAASEPLYLRSGRTDFVSRIHPLFLVRDQVETRVTGSDVVNI